MNIKDIENIDTKLCIDGVEINGSNCYSNKTWTFPRKGYARIYVEKQEDAETVKKVIKTMDEYEYNYLPDGLITVFDGHIDTVYAHKFCDLDIGYLIENCWKLGIKIFAIDGRYGHGLFE